MRKPFSKKTTVDGITFDSKLEAEYYVHLKKLKKDGLISGFILQPCYELFPKCERFGKRFRKMEYKADFELLYPDGHRLVVDVKGFAMEDAILKRKIFACQHPEVELKWVGRYQGQWMDYDLIKSAKRKAKKEKKK